MQAEYSSKTQIRIGKEGEQRIADWLVNRSRLAGRCTLKSIPMDDQKEQGDWLLQYQEMGSLVEVSIEVKTDEMAHETGNIFVETVGDGGWPFRPGWAVTTQATFVFYLIAFSGELLIFRPGTIRTHLRAWARQYPYRSVLNKEWVGLGVCVPISVVRPHCEMIAYV